MNNQRLFGLEWNPETTDERYTPKAVFDDLAVTFDLDVASPPAEYSLVPARNVYTIEDDGLASPWYGFVWMNPPWSQSGAWVKKFIEHGDGIALLPASKGAKWMMDLWRSDASVAFFDSKRYGEFLDYQLKPASVSFSPLFWAFGSQGKFVLERLGRTR
jgi:hypothetical protein